MKFLIAVSIALSTAMTLPAQQAPDSADGADVSAAQAAIQKVEQAGQELKSATPDAATIREAEYQQHMRDLDAESKTDFEIFKEKLPEVVSDATDKAADKMFDNMKEETFDKVGKAFDNPASFWSDVLEEGKAFLEAYTPSYTAAPKDDQGADLTPEQQQNLDDQLNRWSAAQEKYDQAIQDLNDLAWKQQNAHPSLPKAKPKVTTIAPETRGTTTR